MAVTMKDVAELAGVSTSAVSRAFTPGTSVSPKTRRKVEAAAEALGYVPNLIASSLATSRTKLIGLIANNFRNPAFLEVFDLYTRALQERGLRPLLVNLTDVTDPTEPLRLLRQYSVDGVIVATSTLPPGFALAFRQAGVPVVHAFGRASAHPPVHVVGIDNEAAGALAADTLLARGYRSVAFLGGPRAATSTVDRAAGFSRRLEAAGARLAALAHADAYAYEAGARAMRPLLADSTIEAVFCGDDLICMGAMDAARDAGRRVPDDLGFLGFNDMSMAGWTAYRLTTVRQPIADIILTSVDIVVALVETSAPPPAATLFPCAVVERGTLRPPRPVSRPGGGTGAAHPG